MSSVIKQGKLVLYNFARDLNHKRKKILWEQRGKQLSSVRRIERVHPVAGRRLVAMTFDDGPCAKDFMDNGKGLTASILDILARYGAKGTFNIIGTTAGNYPDQAGGQGTVNFGGIRYDHYPCFGEDSLAGAVNQPELVQRILVEGHEITNHSYSHRLFGPKKVLYGSRQPLQSMDEVLEDLEKLHRYVEKNYNYVMKLSRPPHYVDRVTGGGDAYDACRLMGYQYLAASFDGGGWQPCQSYDEEVRRMLEPMQRLLAENPDALNGQIIFQKDGCSMSLRTPVIDALPRQLELLQRYGYEVVSVSELLKASPFLDLAPESPSMDAIRELLESGHIVGYQNNTFHPERPLTRKELLLMLASPEQIQKDRIYSESKLVRRVAQIIPVKSVSGNELLALASAWDVELDQQLFRDRPNVSREAAMPLIAGMARAIDRRNGRNLCTLS